MALQQSPPHKILRPKEVFERVKKSRVTLWRDVRAGTFPPPIQLGPNSIGWYEHEIEHWLESRPRRTYGAEVPHMVEAEAGLPEAGAGGRQSA